MSKVDPRDKVIDDHSKVGSVRYALSLLTAQYRELREMVIALESITAHGVWKNSDAWLCRCPYSHQRSITTPVCFSCRTLRPLPAETAPAPAPTIKDALETASREAAEAPEHERIIAARNRALAEAANDDATDLVDDATDLVAMRQAAEAAPQCEWRRDTGVVRIGNDESVKSTRSDILNHIAQWSPVRAKAVLDRLAVAELAFRESTPKHERSRVEIAKCHAEIELLRENLKIAQEKAAKREREADAATERADRLEREAK